MNTLKIKADIKRVFPLLMIMLFSISAFHAKAQTNTGQRQRGQAIRQDAIHKLQEAKWAFIIYRLNLSEERSNQLLPVYQSFEAEKRAIMKSASPAFKGSRDSMNDSQADAFMNARMENQKKLLELRERYKPKFLKVLSAKELLTLITAEQDFAMKIRMEKQRRKDKGGK